jgi:predicted amidophosphoribosyltransferase
MGMGFMMPAMFAEAFRPSSQAQAKVRCPDCERPVPREARFCPHCGHQQLVFSQCGSCGKNLPPSARFCPRCGRPADEKPVPEVCGKCKAENLAGATFCNQCGERLGEGDRRLKIED